jgi:hypothetical protein
MIDPEALRKQIRENPNQMFSLGREDEVNFRRIADEEGYYATNGDMTLNKRGDPKPPVILKRKKS